MQFFAGCTKATGRWCPSAEEYSGEMRNIGVLLLAGLLATLLTAQYQTRVWQRYEGEMQDPVDDPPDARRKGELALGRLRYYSPLDRGGGRYARWGIDANKGDRLFISLMSRLTRLDAGPIETIVELDSEEIFEHPFSIAISVGDWELSRAQAARLRRYFDQGGFLMVDDFHNEREWARFMVGMHQIYPEAQAEELQASDPIYHTLFDTKKLTRVPGQNVVHGSQIERGGEVPHWRAIRDPKGHIVVAICFNMDIGDGWEFADDPDYPEMYSQEAIRTGLSYAIYALTH